MEELQENFSVEKVLGYYADGKLVTWLRDRYLDDIADDISKLNKDDSDFTLKICNAFGVEYNEEVDMEALEERNRKLSLLKQYTDKKEYFDDVDDIAFNQDELYDLLDEDKHTIYLCGDKFSIPLSKRGIHYIGVNSPEVVITSKEKVDFKEKEIQFENVRFDEKYNNVIGVKGMEDAERLYLEGKVQEAFLTFKEQVENGNARAMYYLGKIYCNGYGGVQKDEELAKQWYKKGYEKGDVLARINYAFQLDDENEKKQIIKNSIEELKVVSQNNIVAKYELADLFESSKYVEENYDTYISLNKECANAGFWLSMNIIGNAYYNGKGVEQNYEKAVEWYKKSAEMDYERAQYNLGNCYYRGNGVKKNYEKAVDWYKKATELGNSDAQYELGRCFSSGIGVDIDEKSAFKYYLMSAEQNHLGAQNELGAAYWFGKGVEIDYCKAVTWYEKSAINGSEYGQNNLGVAYYQGTGVEQSLEKAIYWLAKSAEHYQSGKENLFAILDLTPDDDFLGFYDGALYCSQHVEHFTEKVCEIWWAKSPNDRKIIYVDRCETMSFATNVKCVHNDKFTIIAISNIDTNTILQIKNGNAVVLDQWNSSGMPIYAVLDKNELEYGEDVVNCRQKRKSLLLS
ncbi:MAG: SEL1-like repeat protein [Clostridiales bacterium]|nr:SEL1-like repeat protein [Clostridiales bacterium]